MASLKAVFPLAAGFVDAGWSRYQFAERDDGEKVSANDLRAVRWDLLGALLAAAEELGLIERWPAIEKRINGALARAYAGHEVPGPMSFNMFLAKDERSVLRLLAEAFNE